MIDPPRIGDAQSLLARCFESTRLARAASLSSPGHDVFLKIETDLPTGSFKVRGAIYSLAMRMAGEGVREVVCASTGNHGAAVAYAAGRLGCAATIFLPVDPNPVKAARIRDLGARLVESGADLSSAIEAAGEYAQRESAFFLHDASDANVPIGTATIGVEIVDQRPDVDLIYVPMGDTALIRGVAAAAKHRRTSIRIVGVVAAQAPAYLLSWQKVGQRAGPADSSATEAVVETATCETIADGLAVRRPLADNVAAIGKLVDDVVAVSEDEMIAAIRSLYGGEGVLAEPAGAAATAALLKSPRRERTSVVLVTGGNIAPDLRRSVIG
jgi:threonine dehydratase